MRSLGRRDRTYAHLNIAKLSSWLIRYRRWDVHYCSPAHASCHLLKANYVWEPVRSGSVCYLDYRPEKAKML